MSHPSVQGLGVRGSRGVERSPPLFRVLAGRRVIRERFAGTALVSIPLTLLFIHFALIPFDGSSVNPARSLGPALVGSQWTGFWVFVVGPAAGAIIAWLIYAVVIKGDTDLRGDIRGLRAEVRPPKAPPTAEAAPPPTG